MPMTGLVQLFLGLELSLRYHGLVQIQLWLVLVFPHNSKSNGWIQRLFDHLLVWTCKLSYSASVYRSKNGRSHCLVYNGERPEVYYMMWCSYSYKEQRHTYPSAFGEQSFPLLYLPPPLFESGSFCFITTLRTSWRTFWVPWQRFLM